MHTNYAYVLHVIYTYKYTYVKINYMYIMYMCATIKYTYIYTSIYRFIAATCLCNLGRSIVLLKNDI